MSTINDGGPAFPSANAVQCGEFHTNGHAGMSLRDHFAGQALPAIIALPTSESLESDVIARAAYLMADAMLRARANPATN